MFVLRFGDFVKVQFPKNWVTERRKRDFEDTVLRPGPRRVDPPEIFLTLHCNNDNDDGGSSRTTVDSILHLSAHPLFQEELPS